MTPLLISLEITILDGCIFFFIHSHVGCWNYGINSRKTISNVGYWVMLYQQLTIFFVFVAMNPPCGIISFHTFLQRQQKKLFCLLSNSFFSFTFYSLFKYNPSEYITGRRVGKTHELLSQLRGNNNVVLYAERCSTHEYVSHLASITNLMAFCGHPINNYSNIQLSVACESECKKKLKLCGCLHFLSDLYLS